MRVAQSQAAEAPAKPGPGQGEPGARARARDSHVFAALDLGTNNCRLLIAKASGDGFVVIDSFSRTVRLGEGLAQTGALAPGGMKRAMEALRICADKMKRRGVTRARAVATEACRRAKNGPAFIRRVQSETGIALDVVDTKEEARLALASCAPLLERTAAGALVFDIGGGSTELIWVALDGARPAVLALASAPVGVVTLAERHGPHLAPEQLAPMVAEATAALAQAAPPELDRRFATGDFYWLGASGTVTTLASVHLGLERYIRDRVDGLWLQAETACGIGRAWAAKPFDARAAHPCIGVDRADLLLPGVAILEGIRALWPAVQLRVADRGLREGMLHALMEKADKERRRRRGGRRRRKPVAAKAAGA